MLRATARATPWATLRAADLQGQSKPGVDPGLNAEQVLHEAFIKARDARLKQEEALRRDREDVQMERLLQAYARAHPEAHLSTTIRKAVAHYLQHERRPLGPIPDLAQCHRKHGEVHILDTKGYLLRTYTMDEVKQIVASQP